MYQYPDVQKKAQEEIDRVIGNTRLPTHLDQPDLPYIMAVMKESLRWHAATPQGMHRFMAPDISKVQQVSRMPIRKPMSTTGCTSLQIR
jgi:cytochrome P450